MSVHDEVLLEVNKNFTPAKIMDISSITMQGMKFIWTIHSSFPIFLVTNDTKACQIWPKIHNLIVPIIFREYSNYKNVNHIEQSKYSYFVII